MFAVLSQIGYQAFLTALRQTSSEAGKSLFKKNLLKQANKASSNLDKRRFLSLTKETVIGTSQLALASYITEEAVKRIAEAFDIEEDDIVILSSLLDEYDPTGLIAELAFTIVGGGLLYGAKTAKRSLNLKVKRNGETVSNDGNQNQDNHMNDNDHVTSSISVYKSKTVDGLFDVEHSSTPLVSAMVIDGKLQVSRTLIPNFDATDLNSNSDSKQSSSLSFAALSLLSAGLWGANVVEEVKVTAESDVPRILTAQQRVEESTPTMLVPLGETVWSYNKDVLWADGERVRLRDLHKYLTALLTSQQQELDVMKPGEDFMTRQANKGTIIRALQEGIRRLEEGSIGMYLDVLLLVIKNPERAYDIYFKMCGQMSRNKALFRHQQQKVS